MTDQCAKRRRVNGRQNWSTLPVLMLLLLPIMITLVTMTTPRITLSTLQENDECVSIVGQNAPADPSSWANTYGGSGDDVVWSVQNTTDGGYILSGWTNSFGAGGYDYWVLRLNSTGSVVWQKTYGGAGNDIAHFVRQTSDEGYIVLGVTTSFGAGGLDFWVLRLDSAGSVVWQKTYGGTGEDYGFYIEQTSDGGYVAAGYTTSFGAGDYDVWVLKLDSSGSVSWQNTYGGSGKDIARSVLQTSDGGYIVAGYTMSFGAGTLDVWILKLDSTGSLAWQKIYGGYMDDYVTSIQQVSDGGYIAAGTTLSFGAGDYSVWILRLSSIGSIMWQKTYGGASGDYSDSIQQTSDGGYIVAGHTISFGAGDWDVWVLKLDSTGFVTWQKTYGGSSNDQAYSVGQTIDGGYIVAGFTGSFGAVLKDVWALKLTSNGSLPWDSAATVRDSTATPQDTNAIEGTSSGTTNGGGSGGGGSGGGGGTGGGSGATPIVIGSVVAIVLVLLLLVVLVYVGRSRAQTEIYSERALGNESEEETAETEEPPPRSSGPERSHYRVASVVTPDSCPRCGAKVKALDALFCWSCGTRIEPGVEGVLVRRRGKRAVMAGRCMVCNLDVRESHEAVWCPYCANIAHRAHLLEWLHVKDYCPLCSKHLNESDLGKQS